MKSDSKFPEEMNCDKLSGVNLADITFSNFQDDSLNIEEEKLPECWSKE